MIDFYKYGGKQLYYANTLDTIEADDTSKREDEAGCGPGGDLYYNKIKKKDKELLN
jgi:hypothetical protein